MQLIRQQKKRDCGIAVVAMVAGCSYDGAAEAFRITGHDGLDTQTSNLRAALRQFGITLGHHCIPIGEKRPQDLGRDLILAVNSNAQGWHWVVWDHHQQRILDPLPYKRLRVGWYLTFERSRS